MLKWLAGSLVLALVLSFVWHENKAVKQGKAEVVQEYAHSAQEQAIEALQTDKQLLEKKALADAATIKDKDSIIAKHNSTIRSLRERPTREESAKADASSSGTGTTCTGSELSREDGEFLAGEASRAQQLVRERDYYYERYEDARISLEKLNGKD